VASAPMLSHGGSRLNASKPEANPKTSCPKSLTKSFFLTKTKNLCWNEASGVSWTFLAFRSIRCYVNKQCSWKASLFSCPLFLWNLANLQKTFLIPERKTTLHIQKKNRIASQTIAAFRCLDGAKYMKNSRDFSFLSSFKIDLF